MSKYKHIFTDYFHHFIILQILQYLAKKGLQKCLARLKIIKSSTVFYVMTFHILNSRFNPLRYYVS